VTTTESGAHNESRERLVALLRRARLLQLADSVSFWIHCLRNRRRNRDFRRAHPDFPVPPAGLAYDAYGEVDWKSYFQGGRQTAEMMAELINAHATSASLRILEWGCGPGRVIRHLAHALTRPSVLTGCDYNGGSVAWCQQNLPGIRFVPNRLEPPIDVESGEFDCIYAFSVLTHLSAEAHELWRAELLRLLSPGGVLILTTQGDGYRDRYLSDEERRRYNEGSLVIRGSVVEGKKWFSAFHPPSYMRDRFCREMQVLEHRPGNFQTGDIPQDIWVCHRP
jgi:SAM-dependent methyltransferase